MKHLSGKMVQNVCCDKVQHIFVSLLVFSIICPEYNPVTVMTDSDGLTD